MRLNNYISSTGLCSRREADKLIESGKVTINGKVAQLGQRLEEGDVVKVNGKLIKPKNDKNNIYIALNKPKGITCTTERHIEGNIIDYIGHKQRIFPIGRLDKPSEGLILLTNDGSIVNTLLRSENNYEKEYIVTVDKPITKQFIEKMGQGVRIFNPVANKYTKTNPCPVEQLNKYDFRIILSQGLNRQIRRMCEHFGYEVKRLQRVRIGSLTIRGLEVGKWRYLEPKEVERLLKNNQLKQNVSKKKAKHDQPNIKIKKKSVSKNKIKNKKK